MNIDERGKLTHVDPSDLKNDGRLVLPASAKKLTQTCLWRCKDDIRSVDFGNDQIELDASLFFDCKELTDANLPKNLQVIHNSIFWGCSSLPTITIPNAVHTIDNYAFAYCGALETVTLPASVQTIGHSVFYRCTSLKEIIVKTTDQQIIDNIKQQLPEYLRELVRPETKPFTPKKKSMFEKIGLFRPPKPVLARAAIAKKDDYEFCFNRQKDHALKYGYFMKYQLPNFKNINKKIYTKARQDAYAVPQVRDRVEKYKEDKRDRAIAQYQREWYRRKLGG